MSDVVIARTGRAGRITLNRPAALNALTHPMVAPIHVALDGFKADDDIGLVVLDAAGDRAFCAGGDIVQLYRTGRTDPAQGRAFWRDEYRLNAAIARFPKPIVALLDGIVMGGGVGLGGHASHRIVTERSMVAMPETSIGFSPDVGGTRLLARAPGRTGDYLATTGARMSGADAIFAGFADHFVRADRLPDLVAALAGGSTDVIADLAEPPPPSTLETHAAEIDRLFAAPDVPTLLAHLDGSDFARATAAAIARNAPFSVVAALHAVRAARAEPAIEACLAREYRYSWRVLDRDDFYEGVRAAVVDKDRNPRWSPADVAGVDPADIAAALAPLGAEEWTP